MNVIVTATARVTYFLIFDPMDYGGISLVCLDGNVSALIWESVTTRAASLLQLAALVLFLSVWKLLCRSPPPLTDENR